MKPTVLLYIFLSTTYTFSQGNIDGFFKSKGQLDLAFSASFSASKHYLMRQDKIEVPRSQGIISAFGIYGLTDNWSVIVGLPLINLELQDASVFTKYKLAHCDSKNGEFTLAPAVGISFPMSKYDTETAQAIGQRATVVQSKLLLQYKHLKNWFIQVQGGYNYAIDPVPSAFAASIKVGYIYEKWYFDIWADYQYGIGGEDYQEGRDFRDLGVSFAKLGGVIYRNIGDSSGVFFNGSYIFSGRNIGQAFYLSTGCVLKL
jgi:hypothetical protein